MTLIIASILATYFLVLRRTVNALAFSNFSVFLGIWIALLFLHSLKLRGYDDLSIDILLYIVVFFSIYFVTYILATIISARDKFKFKSANESRFSTDLICAILFALWAGFFIIFIKTLGGTGSFISLLSSGGARLELNIIGGINVSYYIFAYFFIIAASMGNPLRSRAKKIVYAFAVIVVLFSLLFTAAKVNFMTASFILYAMWFNRNGFGWKAFLIHSIILIVLMYVFIFTFAIYTGKVFDQNLGSVASISDILNISSSAFMYPYDYITGSIAALNEVFELQTNSDYPTGSISFGFLYKALALLGLLDWNIQLPPHNEEFVLVSGLDTNVYTFIYDIKRDFGVASLIIASILGLLHQYLDRSEWIGARISLINLSQASKVSAVLSFVNFGYGGTFFAVAFLIFIIHHLLTREGNSLMSR